MTENDEDKVPPARRRLAIIGGGSSGLICLKMSLEMLSVWDVKCFEKSDRITGCWGNPYPEFCSTSTKYTTQFACYPIFDATVKPDRGASRDEFFRNGEYGDYLEQFAEHFKLRPHIKPRHCVENIRRGPDGVGWEVTVRSLDDDAAATVRHYDAVVICTGLAAEEKPVSSAIPTLSAAELNKPEGLGHIRNQRIVVIGGGESAVDYAYRLSRPELGNTVFLSLQSGIRVSPRYHPIRGVPSDFLRNRLMLSIHEDIRNWIGQRFVEARIRYQEIFQRLFPGTKSDTDAAQDQKIVNETSSDVVRSQKEWAYKLTKAAKDELFNMFHNKSDDFLGAVARRELTIVGPPIAGSGTRYRDFDTAEELDLSPDLLVPAIGYRSTVESLSSGLVKLSNFYLGCCHIDFPDLYLIGFARPIIGNIPSISEMQARFVCGLIAGIFPRPPQIQQQHHKDTLAQQKRYSKLNLAAMYPVEMFPYCDRLAKYMKCYPSLRAVGSLSAWSRLQLAPATTIHYFQADPKIREHSAAAPIYLPPIFIALLLLLKSLDPAYRLLRFLSRRR